MSPGEINYMFFFSIIRQKIIIRRDKRMRTTEKHPVYLPELEMIIREVFSARRRPLLGPSPC